jgi:hypothetical protein
MFDKAVIALARKDEVIEKGDAEGIGRALEPGGYLAILRAGFQAPRGVIVRHYDCAGSVDYRVGVHFPGMHDRRR